MRIKVAFVDTDSDYLQRVKTKLRKDYADQIEASYYTDFGIFITDQNRNKADIAVVNIQFRNDAGFVNVKCPVLFVSEDNSSGRIDEYRLVGKYHRFEELYRNILSVYSDSAQGMEGFVSSMAEGRKLIVFASPAGGTGSSTMAVACAEHFAQRGMRVAYLNLERMPFNYYTRFNGGFEEILFTLSENRTNLSMKLESMIQKTQSGVFTLPSIKNPLDLCALSTEEIETLIKAMLQIEGIDYVIVDADFELDDRTYMLFDRATQVVLTTDGRIAANIKLSKALECLRIMESKYSMIEKIRILYNRFSTGNFNNKLTDNCDIPELGVLPRYKATTPQVIAEVSGSDIFNRLI